MRVLVSRCDIAAVRGQRFQTSPSKDDEWRTERSNIVPKVLQIKAEPLTAEAYRPFGQVIGIDIVQMKIVNDRFRMGIIKMRYQPFRISHLNRHLKST
jgi:hypothetical protein